MNVASLELCRELYELSGWDNEQYFDIKHGDIIAVDDDRRTADDIPAYDLGYLLRKLPGIRLEQIDKDYWTAQKSYSNGPEIQNYKSCDADTPEDAACKLAIELIKQGIIRA